MKVFAISDIHGCLDALQDALDYIVPYLDEGDAKLVLCGDYTYGGTHNYAVCETIMKLQNKYGWDKVIALLGNHETEVMEGRLYLESSYYDEEREDRIVDWLYELPRYHVEGNTIFCHAGICEEAGEDWEFGTEDYVFTEKYPAELGQVPGLDMKIVAGHAGTSEIAKDPHFHDIYYDGASHYYIDGTVLDSGYLPILMVDTDTDKYYEFINGSWYDILPYNELS
ncbi:MAG: metallophosphoesterase [Coriobacteriales bacterium]|nr:metallophosphoesterase [Coriobacteriales bacterium]